MIDRLLLAAVGPVLGLSELITVEGLRLLGTTIAAAASIYAAASARRSTREARRTRRDVRRTRQKMRAGDGDGHVVVIDQPAEPDPDTRP